MNDTTLPIARPLPMLAQNFYSFTADPCVTHSVLAQVRSAVLHTDSHINAADGHITRDQFHHVAMLQWFEQCLESVRSLIFGPHLRLRVVTCWANVNPPLTNIGLHGHCNSLVSGIFYLTDETHSRTEFWAPNPWLHWARENFLSVGVDPNGGPTDDTWLRQSIQPCAGQLILFPSTVRHRTMTHRGTARSRVTVAFNAWPEISVNALNPTCRLDMKPQALLGSDGAGSGVQG